MPRLNELDRQRNDLAKQFPGWQIWYVYGYGGHVTWCARPNPLINATSVRELAEMISSATPGVPPDG